MLRPLATAVRAAGRRLADWDPDEHRPKVGPRHRSSAWYGLFLMAAGCWFAVATVWSGVELRHAFGYGFPVALLAGGAGSLQVAVIRGVVPAGVGGPTELAGRGVSAGSRSSSRSTPPGSCWSARQVGSCSTSSSRPSP